jgi:hypothetical protein
MLLFDFSAKWRAVCPATQGEKKLELFLLAVVGLDLLLLLHGGLVALGRGMQRESSF